MGNYLERIDFKNNQAPWLNDINLNKLQDNVEDAITKLHAQGVATGDTLPIGSILPFAGNTIPENWLECKGQAVSRTDYAELFSVIGTIWGVGDGSTTFNLPDLQGKITVGKDEDDTDFDEVGKTGGEKEHTLTVAEMPAHNHNFNKTNVATMAGSGANEMSQTGGGRTYELLGIQNTGGSQAHNNLQPYAVSAYIIKAKQSSGLVADVVDSLTSDSTTDALSAKQGKVLNEKIAELDKRIINGTRNKVYLVGKQNANPTGTANSGQLALFVSNLGDYNESVPCFFAINKDGEVERTVLATVPSSTKKVYVYTDNEYDYIFLCVPNYHDNFFVDVLVNYNVTLDLQEMTVDEFNTYVASMTKVAEV